MKHKDRSSRSVLPFLLPLLLLNACDNRQEEAQAAYARYQAAMVSGDMRAARAALGALVQADDSNADYWIQLGQLSMQLTDIGGAYTAFQRAHELDRGNVEVLATLTQLALRSGNLAVAEEHARRLELVSPTHPAVPLTKGYVALRRNDLDEAEKQALVFNEAAPYDPSGKVFQARILLARDKPDDAIALLDDQIAQQPSDEMVLRALASLYELQERWGEAAEALQGLLKWQPKDAESRVRLVDFQLRSGQIGAAADTTMAGVENENIDALLAPWVATGQQKAIADRLFGWSKSAHAGRRIAVARFLLTADQPGYVIELLSREATLPVQPDNAVANALFGAALAGSGRKAEGLARLDAVLKLDGTVREALAARAKLRSQAGAHPQAIEDAQRLVAADSASAAGRLVLAQTYVAAGDPGAARRTLWEGFHEIAADRSIYDALRVLVARSEGPQAAARVAQEYYDQRNDQITRSFA